MRGALGVASGRSRSGRRVRCPRSSGAIIRCPRALPRLAPECYAEPPGAPILRCVIA